MPVVGRAVAALIALLLMAMSCEVAELQVDGVNGRVVIDGQDGSPLALPLTRTFSSGASVELTPVPDAGFEFVRWEGDASGSEVPLGVTMSHGRVVTIVFEELESLPDPPSNDAFGDARVLSAASGSVSGTNVAASKELDEPNHAGATGGASVWWSYRPVEDGTLTVDTNGSAVDTLVAVYTGSSLGALTEVGSDDDGGAGFTSEVSIPVTGGTTYSVAVDGRPGNEGAITLNWAFEADSGTTPGDATITIDVTPDAASWAVREGDAAGAVTTTGTGDGDASVSPGTYVLSANLPGYSSVSDTVTVGDGEVINVPLTLSELTTPRTLTVEASGGSGTVLVDGVSEVLPFSSDFEDGMNVEIEAVPASGYIFSEWTGDVATSDNPTTVVMTTDRTATATFAAITINYELTIQGSNGGVLIDGRRETLPFTDTYLDGSTLQLEADPDTGYTFQSWSGSISSTSNPLGLLIHENTTLTATIEDTTAPTLAVSDPTNTFDGESNVTITGTAVDEGSGLNLLEVRLNGGTWNPCNVIEPSFTCTVARLSFGGNLIEIRASDRSDNSAVVELQLVREDAEFPFLDIVDPTDGSTTNVSTVNVTGVARDDETGIATVEQRFAGGSWSPCSRPTDTTFACVVTNLTADVSNTIEIAATDGAGNTTMASLDVVYAPTAETRGFDIELHYFDETFTASQKAAFESAVARWESVVIGELEDVYVERSLGESCGQGEPALERTVDDVLVFVSSFTDAVGGLLGMAGPCVLRGGATDAGTALVGYMQFDTADLANLESSGFLEATIVHEMAHVLGLGAVWEENDLLDYVPSDGASSCNTASDYLVPPRYVGTAGVGAWQGDLGGSGSVPVEATGERGTRCGHWEEATFDDELMTGWLDGGDDALSILSVRSLEDLGYTVDPDAADPYVVPPDGALTTQGAVDLATSEIVLMPTRTVDPRTGRYEEIP